MADLYTDLRALKMAMNGGAIPPMTPVPENVQHFIDPSLVPGLGALCEDAEQGLRCPVRGCGVWRQFLTQHLNAVHADIGGAQSIREALDIPKNTGLVSSRLRAILSHNGRANSVYLPHTVPQRHAYARMGEERSRRARTVGYLNGKNSCPAQMRKALYGIYQDIGRAPSASEGRRMLGRGLFARFVRLYGTWTNVIAQAEIPGDRSQWFDKYHRRYTKQDLLTALSAWYSAHGELPSQKDAAKPTKSPPIPSRGALLHGFGTTSWPEAMRRAAARLNIYGGRYGLPESVRPKAEQQAA